MNCCAIVLIDNDHELKFMRAFYKILQNGILGDVTLLCHGQKIEAHKNVLSIGSSYFKNLFENDACDEEIMIPDNIQIEEMEAIMDFIYKGRTIMKHARVELLFEAAKMLKIKGFMKAAGNVFEKIKEQKNAAQNSRKNTDGENPKETCAQRSVMKIKAKYSNSQKRNAKRPYCKTTKMTPSEEDPKNKINNSANSSKLPSENTKDYISILNDDPSKKIKTLKTDLFVSDLRLLVGSNWINDAVITAYFDLIQERSKEEGFATVYVFSSYFFLKLVVDKYKGVKKWTKNSNIFDYELIFIPLCIISHWSLAVINNKEKTISYYDSFSDARKESLQVLKEYLFNEYKNKKGTEMKENYETIVVKNVQTQKSGDDCGIFTMKFADYISRGQLIDFKQENIPDFRRLIISELLNNKLSDT